MKIIFRIFAFSIFFCIFPIYQLNADEFKSLKCKKIIFYYETVSNVSNIFIVKDKESISKIMKSINKLESKLLCGCVHAHYVNYYLDEAVERVEFCDHCYLSCAIRMPDAFYNEYKKIVDSEGNMAIINSVDNKNFEIDNNHFLEIPDIFNYRFTLPDMVFITAFVDNDGDIITFLVKKYIWINSEQKKNSNINSILRKFPRLKFKMKEEDRSNKVYKIDLKLVKKGKYYYIEK